VIGVGGKGSPVHSWFALGHRQVRKTSCYLGALMAEPMSTRSTRAGVAWADGTKRECAAVIWCTGFRSALRHLRSLALRRDGSGHVGVGGSSGTQALREPRLYLVGYGDWTGRRP